MSLKIYNDPDELPGDRPIIATIGTFDGLHLGHQAILKRLTVAAGAEGFPVIITFNPHPRDVVTPHLPPLLLTGHEEKIRIFSDYFSGSLLTLEFDRILMNMTAAEFVRNILVEKIGIKHLIVGYDHAFGKNRSGTAEELKELTDKYSIKLDVVPPVLVDEMPISSTRIRRLFINGDFKKAKKLLGHPYPIFGTVTKGIGLGKKIGYPTANLDVSPRKLLPGDGVYSCSLEVDDKKFNGMMFIGKNHFNPNLPRTIEVNIFDFNKDIYGRGLFLYPEEFIRENRKYEKTQQLVKQIELDKKEIMKIKNIGV